MPMTISEDIFECIPQNDLDCYYNSKWKQNNKLSNNEVSINNFTIIQDKIDKEMRYFINNAHIDFPIDPTRKSDIIMNNMIQLKKSYHDQNNYSKTLIMLVDLIKNISNITELANVIRVLHGFNINTIFTMNVIPHFRAPDVYTLVIGEIPLTLESNKIYEALSNEFMKTYGNVLRNVHKFVTKYWNYDMSDPVEFVGNIITFEILFSKSNLLLEESIDPKITHNSVKYNEFINLFDTDNFWEIILDKYVTCETYISYENKKALIFIKNFLQTMTQNELSMIKDYLVYCLIKKYGLFTGIAEIFNKLTLSSMDKNDVMIEMMYETFGYYLQTIYESEHVNLEKNNIVREMFIDMKSYCLDFFKQSDIFSSTTKQEAINKLNKLDIIIGKQDYFIDLTELPKLGDNLYDNLMMLHSFYFNKMINFVGQPINRYYLSITSDLLSFKINAYYDPSANIIFIPTSIIDDMFLNLDNDLVYNYGSIGSIIGHEMMHSFDNFGALFDSHGHLHNWWTEQDYKRYNNEIFKVKKHYSTLSLNGIKLNAESSVSENIADIAGIKLSLRTYIKKYLHNTNINNLSASDKEHLKKFFESWVTTLRAIELDEITENAIQFDVHSPNVIRANAPFSHLDEYYKIFDVQPKHQNYLHPHLRTRFMDI